MECEVWLKIQVVVDNRKMRILSILVTGDKIHYGRILPELVNDITIKQNKQWIDRYSHRRWCI